MTTKAVGFTFSPRQPYSWLPPAGVASAGPRIHTGGHFRAPCGRTGAGRAGFADANGARLYYEVYGEGEPLLLIPGITVNPTCAGPPKSRLCPRVQGHRL